MLTYSTAFSAAVALQLVTVSLFLYLVVYLPWYQGALPNVSSSRQASSSLQLRGRHQNS